MNLTDKKNGQYQYELFEMLVNWSRMHCIEDNIELNGENIRNKLNGIESLIDMSQCEYELLAKCIGMCPLFFSENEINKMFEQL